jgi:hypothetical protein
MAGSSAKDEGALATLDDIKRVYDNLVAQEVFISTQNFEWINA